MKQEKLISSLLVSAIVSGLVVSYRQAEVTARVSLPNPIIYLAQAQQVSPDSNNSLTAVQDVAKKLKNLLDTLNTDLEKVVNKKIDRIQVNFKTPQDKLATLKTTWEQYKQQLSQNSQNLTQVQSLISQVDSELESLGKYLSPLNQNIIQSLEEYNKKKNDSTYSIQKISKLEEYQKQLFGTESNSTNSDGIFGSGTQGKIKQVLSQSINNLTTHIEEIEKIILGQGKGEANSVSTSSQDSGLNEQVKSLQEEVKKLKIQVEQQGKIIEELKNKLEGKAITRGTETDGQFQFNSRILVLVIFVLVVGLIGWQIWKLWQVSIKKNDLISKFQFSGEDDKARDVREPIESYVMSQSILESQGKSTKKNSSNASSDQHLGQNFPPKQKATNLISTSVQSIKSTVQTSIQGFPNLESIQSKEDLVALYNKSPRALQNEITVVTRTKQSFEQQRYGHSVLISFEKSSSGNYWITLVPQLPSPYYFLVPKANLIINNPTYRTVKKIFNSVGYETKTSNKFKLIRPAVVTYEPEGYWRLSDLGKLEFN